MQEFYINKGSTLPYLRMELIDDGRHSFRFFSESIQNSEVYFTMTNVNTGVVKIANAKAKVIPRETDSCEEQYIICYEWKERDTKEKGTYKGQFKIKFLPDLYSEGKTYPSGDLIMPIREDLMIYIK